MDKSKIMSYLRNVVGDEHVTDEESSVHVYNYDVGGLSTPSQPEGKAEIVVLPKTVEQIQEIVKFANSNRIPLTPFVSGANMGGLAVPLRGGIVVDLHRMNRIIEINEEINYAIVEPGVSFGMLERELRKRDLWVSIPMAPPGASSVVGNVLLAGIGHLAGRYGCQAELLNGLEAVISSGELIRTGSCAISTYWHSRFPIPDLSSLFIGWQGSTGIVTKMSIALFKRPPFQDIYSFGFDDYDEAVNDFMIPWHRLEIGYDCTGMTWGLGAVLTQKHPLPEKPKEEPLLYVYTYLGGFSQEELDFKVNQLHRFVESQRKKGKYHSCREFELNPELKDLRSNIPNPYASKQYDHIRGGGSWVGSFTPSHNWPQAFRETDQIMIKYGVPTATRVSIFRGSHHGMFRCVFPYDSGNLQELKRMKEMSCELVKCIVKHGGLIYKAPHWATDIMLEKAHPGYKNMLKYVKKMLDPNNIMNPGRWGL